MAAHWVGCVSTPMAPSPLGTRVMEVFVAGEQPGII